METKDRRVNWKKDEIGKIDKITLANEHFYTLSSLVNKMNIFLPAFSIRLGTLLAFRIASNRHLFIAFSPWHQKD